MHLSWIGKLHVCFDLHFWFVPLHFPWVFSWVLQCVFYDFAWSMVLPSFLHSHNLPRLNGLESGCAILVRHPPCAWSMHLFVLESSTYVLTFTFGLCHTTPHRTAPHCTALHYLHYIHSFIHSFIHKYIHTIPYHTMPYHTIPLHCITLHCIALHYITLHSYIHYIHT